MSEVAKDLKKLSKTWSNTDAKKGGGSNVKDGEYVVKITSMEVGKSKNGRLQVAEKFKIVEPKKKGPVKTPVPKLRRTRAPLARSSQSANEIQQRLTLFH